MLNWIEAKPGTMPEDLLPLSKYKLWGQDRQRTPYVLVIREHRERPDCAMRVRIDEHNQWCWSDGDGMTPITHWAEYNRPFPWDKKAHEAYIKELRQKFFSK